MQPPHGVLVGSLIFQCPGAVAQAAGGGVIDDAENGQIVIVNVDGEYATCKRLKKYDQSIALLSLNPSYEPMIYSAKQVEELPVRIRGVVVELRAKF